MKETEQSPTIDAVSVVRQIRDRHAALLQGKSPEEIRAFFRREAAAANAETECLLRDLAAPPSSLPLTPPEREASALYLDVTVGSEIW